MEPTALRRVLPHLAWSRLPVRLRLRFFQLAVFPLRCSLSSADGTAQRESFPEIPSYHALNHALARIVQAELSEKLDGDCDTQSLTRYLPVILSGRSSGLSVPCNAAVWTLEQRQPRWLDSWRGNRRYQRYQVIPQVLVNNGIMLYSDIEKGRCNPATTLSVNVRTHKVRRWRHRGTHPRCNLTIPLPLPIQSTPAKVRAYGLKDAHSYPLVSMGKGRDGAHRGIVSCSSRGCLGLS